MGHPFLVHFPEESLQERLQCNMVTFGAIIGACEKGSQWRQSLRLLGRLQREDLEPNVIACSAVISACAKGDQWQLALQLLAHVVETGALACGSACVLEMISLGLGMPQNQSNYQIISTLHMLDEQLSVLSSTVAADTLEFLQGF